MTDMLRRVGTNSLFIYLGRAINLLVTFFVFVYLTNYLGEASFGRLSIALAYIGIFDILANFGLNQILVRELSIEREGSPSILGTGILIKAALTLSSVILACVLVFLFPYPKETAAIIWIVSLNLFISSKLSSTRTIFESFFQARLQMHIPILFNVIDNALFAILTYALTAKYHLGLVGIACIYTFCNLPGAIGLLVKFFRTASADYSFHSDTAKFLLKESLPLSFYLLFSILSTKLDVLLLSWMRGEGDVGLYSAATRLVYPWLFLSTSFSMSLYPLLSCFYENEKEQFAKILRVGVKFILAIAIFLSITFAFHSTKIISALYVHSYAPSAPSFMVLIVALGLSLLNFYFVDILIASKQQNLTTLVLGVSLAVNVGVNLLCIPRFGFLGASYARLLTSLITFAMFYWLLFRRLKIMKLVEYSKIIPLIASSVLTQMALQRLPLLVSMAGSCVAYAACLYFLRIVNQDEWGLFKVFLGGRDTPLDTRS